MIAMGLLCPARRLCLDGISAAAGANATAQVAAAFQVFALKRATQANTQAAVTLIQSLGQAPNPPHLGQQVDATV